MRKLISFIIILTIIIGVMAGVCVNANAETEGYYTYSITDNNEAEIIDVSWEISGNVTVPSTLGGYPVTSIGSQAFDGRKKLTSVTIPDGVKSIGGRAFGGCSGLTNLTIANSVTNIGDWAFLNCSGLTNITISNNVTAIGWGTFQGCSALTDIIIPDGVTSIGIDAFKGCSKIVNITIPDSVTSIGVDAFSNCSSLTDITIPGGVTGINKYLFQGCGALKSITISKSVTKIDESAFFDCVLLKTVKYNGLKADSKKIDIISSGNECLLNATWQYADSVLQATPTPNTPENNMEVNPEPNGVDVTPTGDVLIKTTPTVETTVTDAPIDEEQTQNSGIDWYWFAIVGGVALVIGAITCAAIIKRKK